MAVAPDLALTFNNHEETIGQFALANEQLTGGEGLLTDDRCELRDLLALYGLEQRHALKKKHPLKSGHGWLS